MSAWCIQGVYFGKGPCTYGGGLLLLTFIFYLLFYWIVITGTATHSVSNKAGNLHSHPAVWAVAAEKNTAKQILGSVWRLNEGSQSFDRFISVFPVVLIQSAASPLSHSVWLIVTMKYMPEWRQGDTHEETRNAVPTIHTLYLGFVRTIKWESGKSFSKSWNHPRLRVPALLGCLMKAIPAPVSTTAALLGLLKPRRFCPGACVRLAHGGPHRSL